MAKARSAEDVIDAAIADNMWWEYLCFGLIVVFVGSGVTALFLGYAADNGLVSLAGTGLATLFWPAIKYVAKLRQYNVRIRMYEMALAKAKDADQVTAILREVFAPQPKGKDEAL